MRAAPRIRPARADDAGGIGSIHVRAWRAAYAHLMPADYLAALDERDWADRHRARTIAPEPGTARWVAEHEGVVVGFLVAGPSRDPFEPDAAEIYAIYVDPDRARRGVGKALLSHAVERLRQAGPRRATLWVLRDNADARRFYEAMGWRADGSEKSFALPGREDVELREVRYVLESD